MWIVIISGSVAGLIHVLSGPDHLAAVAPFAIEEGKRSWISGFKWGIGHTLGVWAIGLLAFLFREVLPIGFLSAWSERLVGVMLIAIGIWGIRKAYTARLHYHTHRHDGVEHAHFHIHRGEEVHKHEEEQGHHHSHAPLGIGLLHGLAGSSHLLGVLPALVLPTRLASLTYVVCFGVGSIFAMTFFSWALGKIYLQFSGKFQYAYNWLMFGFSAAAIAVGGVWLSISMG